MLALDYFVGGLPAAILFKMSLDDINTLINKSEDDKEAYGLNAVAEICLIGLVSYFEGFCKN
ncbi:MAG: hypothetical protein ACLPYB_03245 [Desulfobaccales bacterium]